MNEETFTCDFCSYVRSIDKVTFQLKLYGRRYLFCSIDCAKSFARRGKQYLSDFLNNVDIGRC
jgi:YHS domain-containing protein